jgi:hypothetical protein
MRTIKRILLSLLITGFFLATTTPAYAARSYLLELVIFTTQNAGSAEKWTSVDPPLNKRKMARAVYPGTGELELTKELKELKESTFSSYVNRIRKNPRRKVILTTRWVQPVSGPARTIIARISERKDRPDSDMEMNPGNSQGMVDKPLVNGFINFYLDGQYTLEADIRYTPPYRPSILDEQPNIGPVSYRIYEKRRMKSGELNYYDHPKFGMVLLVTPVDLSL